MKEWSWTEVVRLPADRVQSEPDTNSIPDSCPCSCLRSMVRVVDAGTIEQAVLEAELALDEVTGHVFLSIYGMADDGLLRLAATGHDPGDTPARISLAVAPDSMLEAVLGDGRVRWVAVEEGDVSAVAAASLHDHGETTGLLIAEFMRGEADIGQPSALCLHCVASVLSVVAAKDRIADAQADLLLLSRYRSVAELSAQVAHDLNNMMQGVLGNAGIAKLEVPGGSSLGQSLIAIEESAANASILARKLMSFARDNAKGRETCNAVKAVSDAIDLAGTLYLKEVRVEKHLPSKAVSVRMTDNELENALILLIKSSVLQLKPIAWAEVTVSDDADRAVIPILLSMHGVSQSTSSEERMEAASLAAMARNIATRRQALLDISSEPGVITIALTVAKDVSEEPGSRISAAQSPEKQGFNGMPVLVIGKPSAVPMLLGAAGCAVVTMPTWDTSIQPVAEAAPRVIVAILSNASDLDAAVEGRRLLGLPVIAISQQGVTCSAEKASLIDGVLGLPLDLDDLRQMLTRVLR